MCTKGLQAAVLQFIYKDNGSNISKRASVAISRRASAIRRTINRDIRVFSLIDPCPPDIRRNSLVSEVSVEEYPDIHEENFDNSMPMNGAEKILAVHPIFRDISQEEKRISDSFLNRAFYPHAADFNLSIDRNSLLTALDDEECRKLLVCLLLASNSACFYGLTPTDKASVVKLLKENVSFKPLTLAIGDGNNDIPMIQEAHIGIGLVSKEESQAPNYSEIVIKNFAQLDELLLQHGYWSYNRMAKGVLLFFYKNFVLTIITFVYVWFSDYSDLSIFDDVLLVGYNIFFTTLPIIIISVFDQSVPLVKLKEYPQIYADGITGRRFN